MKAMIFAAGLGTRLKPLTDNKPKALVEIGGTSLLERCINQLKKSGISEVIINVHHFAKQMKAFIAEHDNFGITVHISDESEQLLDTGGGILKAREFLQGTEPILIVNVDVLTNLDFSALLSYHRQQHALATLVVRQRSTSRYLLFNDHMLAGWTNKSTGEVKASRPELIEKSEEFAFSGIHLIEPEMLNLISETGKFSIIDLYLRLARQHKIACFEDKHSAWMDLGKIQDVDKAIELIAQLEQ